MSPRLILAATALAAGLCIAVCAQPAACQSQAPSAALPIGQVLPAAATQGKSPADFLRPHAPEVRLWPAAAPGSESQSAPEVINWRTESDTLTKQLFSFPTVTNIHFPSVTPFLPAGTPPAGGWTAVIVAPGGGHQFLTINHEGYDVAQYLADHGIAAFVLKYRLARAPTYPANTYTITKDALADGQRSLRLLRARAAEWRLNPDRIGMMGFSAGGEVAVQCNLNPTEGKPDNGQMGRIDPVDQFSCKMNFEALVYPGVSRLINPTKDWPPVFMACSFDDRTDIAGPAAPANGGATTIPAAQGLADVYLKYKAVGVPAELHIFSTGGHGFGARDRPIEEARWMDNFLAWLTDRGMK